MSNFVKLGTLVDIKTGKLDANASSNNGEYPFFTCSINPLKIDSYSYDCECVLVAGNGDLNVKYYNGKFDAYQRTYIIESKNNIILNVKYLYYFLDMYVDKLREQSIGGVIKYIKLGHLTEAIIPLPIIEKQTYIVKLLDKAKTLINKRRNQIDELNSLIQSIFYDMFGDPMINPKGWNLINFDKIVEDFKYGSNVKAFNKKYNNSKPILRIPNIINGQVDLNDIKYVNVSDKEYKDLSLKDNDILFVRTNGNPDYIARCANITPMETGYIYASYLIRARINCNKYNSNFIKEYFMMPSFRKYIKSGLKTTAGNYNINTQQLKELKIFELTIKIQNEFSFKIQKIRKQKELHQQSLDQLELIYKSLMQRAFNGILFEQNN